MRRASAMPHSVGSLSPDKRHSRLTIVRRGCNRCRIAGIHGAAMYTAPTLRSACSHSSCKLPMSGVEGGSPRPFSWGCKGDILFREREYPPFPRPPHGVGDNRVRPAGAKKKHPFRCVQLRKHSKAREKRYSFGYAVSFIFACYQILWTFPKSRYLCSRYLPLVCG